MSEQSRAVHIEVVDGLRGVAIVLVMMLHLWQLSWWGMRLPFADGRYSLEFIAVAGAAGVALFFFLSAFCLFYPYARASLQAGPEPGLLHYVYRRAIKILPSYLLAIFLILWLFPEVYPVSGNRGPVLDVLMHLLFIHDWFPDTHGSINGVFWSLGVEIQFYVLFPLLAWFFRRRPWLGAVCLFVFAVAFRAWTRTLDEGTFGYFNSKLPAFLDFFAAGMLSAWLVVRIQQSIMLDTAHRIGLTVLAVLATLAILGLFYWQYQIRYDHELYTFWDSRNRHWLALLFAVLTVASACGLSGWRKLVGNPLLIFFSLISYNLYIWHQLLGRLIKDRGWWPANTPVPMDDRVWQWSYFWICVGVSVLVASLITWGIERPLLKHGVRGICLRIMQSRAVNLWR